MSIDICKYHITDQLMVGHHHNLQNLKESQIIEVSQEILFLKVSGYFSKHFCCCSSSLRHGQQTLVVVDSTIERCFCTFQAN